VLTELPAAAALFHWSPKLIVMKLLFTIKCFTLIFVFERADILLHAVVFKDDMQ